jgi:hypothetical protein
MLQFVAYHFTGPFTNIFKNNVLVVLMQATLTGYFHTANMRPSMHKLAYTARGDRGSRQSGLAYCIGRHS